MGYESKIYIVKRMTQHFGEVIAMFDLCKMGSESYLGTRFPGLFLEAKSPRFCFYHDESETAVDKDRYGEIVTKAADNAKVIHWLKLFLEKSPYYRAEMFLKALESIENSGITYEIYHYGY